MFTKPQPKTNKISSLKFYIGNIIIAAFLLIFVLINLKEFLATANLGYLLVVINESVYVGLYLIRERAIATSTLAFDWTIAITATFLGTLLRPAGSFSVFFGNSLITIGTVLNIASVFSLGKSISIVPAERSIKTSGVYQFVRHPMYSSGILTIFGYLLANFSLFNALIVIGNTVLLIIRLNREERFLSKNKFYREYVAKTRSKLLPFIY